ncbi:homeodomain-interacting protein kinase 1-like [Paralichthys olivaceus]|uniref:homeodomain-interacting protein kinase 1-like n=1 Tax=Paralichthys olivaceus TaxID=8255 RepID=UPI00374FF048
MFYNGGLIPSPTTIYQVQKYLGSGSYGVVFQCRNVTTNETVALKMIKNAGFINSAKEEEATLKTLRELHSDRFNIIKLNESFTYMGHCCLVFEHLDMDLLKFMKINPGRHLQLKEIRPILQQLATSLEFLKGAGIIHTDLKPDNIMMVDHVRQPLKVKIIDFGLACNNPEKLIGHTIQCLCYRAPEILLRSLFDWAIDIWSLGCIVAELFMGIVLFPAHDENDLRNQILHMVGKPVFAGDNTQYCFWPKYWMESRFVASLNGLLGVDNYAEQVDLAWFIDLLRRMLTLEPSERITPRGILEHPFITMSHFEGAFKNSLYVKSSMDLKSGCQDNRSDDGGDGCRKILPKSLKKDSSKRTAKPPKSRRKRWRNGPGLDDNSSTKNRKMKLKQELIKIVKAMNDSRAAQSTSTQVH